MRLADRRMPFRPRAAALWLSLAAATAGLGSAAVATGMAFNISPLRIELGAQREFAPFQVRNSSPTPLAIQARVFAWGQGVDGDRYALSDDLIVSPTVVRLGPGQVQHFKLIRRAAATPREATYRVVVDQLPEGATVTATGMMPRLRMAVPVFVDREGASAANLTWTAEAGAVRVANRGGRAARVLDAAAIQPDGTRVALTSPTLGYVLAGAELRWPAGPAASCLPAGSRIVGMLDGARFDAPVRTGC